MTDPRFDPAFQRGYDGPDPELAIRQRTPDEPIAPVTPRPDAAAGPAAVERRSSPEPTHSPSVAQEPELDPEPRLAVRNPFRLALLLLGIALLIVALSTLYSQVQHPQAANSTAQAQFIQLLVYSLPPSLLLAGFVCIILWLAFGALDRLEVSSGPYPEPPQPMPPSPASNRTDL